MNDPAVCFEIVLQYLTEGPEAYDRTRLRVFVTIHYKIVERLLVLIRLHALVHKLDLPNLESMAFDSIIELDRYIKPEHCVTLAGLVFTSKAGFQPVIKRWCLGHVFASFHYLKNNKEWRDLLWLLDVELFMQWEQWVEFHSAMASSPHSSSDSPLAEEVLIGMPTSELWSHPEYALQEKAQGIDTGSTLRLLEEESALTDDDDWKDPELGLPANKSKVGTDDFPRSTKAKNMLGIMDDRASTKSADEETEVLVMMERQRVFRSPSFSAITPSGHTLTAIDTAKAREVMGLSPTSPSSPSSLSSPSKSLTPQRTNSGRGVKRFWPPTPSRLGKVI